MVDANIPVGTRVKVTGGVMQGLEGSVIGRDDIAYYHGADHPGLIPVFLPKYDSTKWWWHHPCQLEEIKADVQP